MTPALEVLYHLGRGRGGGDRTSVARRGSAECIARQREREREREGGRGGERECRSVGEAHPRVRGADLLRCVVPTVHVVDLPLWESLLDSSHHGGQGLVGGLLPRRRRGLAQSRHLSSREEGLDLARSARLNSGSPARHKRHTCAQGLLPLALFALWARPTKTAGIANHSRFFRKAILLLAPEREDEGAGSATDHHEDRGHGGRLEGFGEGRWPPRQHVVVVFVVVVASSGGSLRFDGPVGPRSAVRGGLGGAKAVGGIQMQRAGPRGPVRKAGRLAGAARARVHSRGGEHHGKPTIRRGRPAAAAVPDGARRRGHLSRPGAARALPRESPRPSRPDPTTD